MYLVKRHQVWWAMHDIPRKLRPAFGGRTRFSENLRTKDADEAKVRGAILLARWRSEINRAQASTPDRIEREAEFWNRLYNSAPEHEKKGIRQMIVAEAHEGIVIPAALRDGILDYSDPRYDEMPAHEDASRFVDIATGNVVRTDRHVEEYLGTLQNEAKTVDMKRSTILRFCEQFPYTSGIRRKAVQHWVNRAAEAGLARATIQRALSDLRQYWAYLNSIEVVPDDVLPFEKLAVPRIGKPETGDRRRAFEPVEVVDLLKAAADQGDQTLCDLIELAMWTGCRIEELCALPTANVNLVENFISIEDSKTEAGWRQVPIHKELMPLIQRLCERSTDGFVLCGLKENKYGDRSNAVGKRFGRLKKTKGFGAAFVFHSIRKTVATMLENANVPENIAADILGHEKDTMTYGLYSAGSSLALKKEALSRLQYPILEKRDPTAGPASL